MKAVFDESCLGLTMGWWLSWQQGGQKHKHDEGYDNRNILVSIHCAQQRYRNNGARYETDLRPRRATWFLHRLLKNLTDLLKKKNWNLSMQLWRKIFCNNNRRKKNISFNNHKSSNKGCKKVCENPKGKVKGEERLKKNNVMFIKGKGIVGTTRWRHTMEGNCLVIRYGLAWSLRIFSDFLWDNLGLLRVNLKIFFLIF